MFQMCREQQFDSRVTGHFDLPRVHSSRRASLVSDVKGGDKSHVSLKLKRRKESWIKHWGDWEESQVQLFCGLSASNWCVMTLLHNVCAVTLLLELLHLQLRQYNQLLSVTPLLLPLFSSSTPPLPVLICCLLALILHSVVTYWSFVNITLCVVRHSLFNLLFFFLF